MHYLLYPLAIFLLMIVSGCQEKQANQNFSTGTNPDIVEKVDFQPLAKHVNRLIRKLEYLGAPLPAENPKTTGQPWASTP